MPKFAAAGLAIVALLQTSPALAAPLATRLDSAIAPYFPPGGPGATVIVVKGGKTVFAKAYGMADIAHRTPMSVHTSLRIGSITKQFTAAAVLMLAGEGKLALSDDITRFLPDYPTHGRHITIEHLLTHTSGIASYTERPGYVANMARDMSVSEMIDSFKDEPLQFDPGTDWHYNNSGYFLLGAIVEKVSGQPYGEFVAQHIFAPLGMRHTAYGGGARATGYVKDTDGFSPSSPLSATQMYAAGGLVSTVEDLARWDAALAHGKLVSAADWLRAATPYRLVNGKSTGYGYGLAVGTLQGVPMIDHGGSVNGFRSFALRLPEQQVYVAVLSNAGSGLVQPDTVAMKAAAIAIGRPLPEHKAIALAPAALDAFAGTYQMDGSARRIIRRVGNQLVMQAGGGIPTPVLPFSDHEFFRPDTIDYLVFARNDKGVVTAVTVHEGDKVRQDARIGDAPPERKAVRIAHAAFDAHAGRYEFAPNFVIELSREGDTLYAQATGEPRREIIALGDNDFYSSYYDAEVRLVDQPGQPGTQAVLVEDGREMKGRKL